jgi:hypothetical protein
MIFESEYENVTSSLNEKNVFYVTMRFESDFENVTSSLNDKNVPTKSSSAQYA